MSPGQSILDLPYLEIQKMSANGGRVYFEVEPKVPPQCPYCGESRLRLKNIIWRQVRHASITERGCWLIFKARKYCCLTCKKYFTTRLEGLQPYQRVTEPFKKEVALKHHHGISSATLSGLMKIGGATVERYYQQFIKRKVAERESLVCPTYLGIDEHFFSKKKGYATTLCDLKNHKVYDIFLGRSESSLASAFSKLQGRNKVKVVVMDMSITFRSIVRKYFPNAKIVADRFHVVRLINHHFLKVWQSIDPEGRKNRGLLSLMRRHQSNLSPNQWDKLLNYFAKYPAMKAIYLYKQEVVAMMLYKTIKFKKAQELIPQFLGMIKTLKESGFEAMKVLGETLDAWSEEIVTMWRFRKTNGITEGFHTKMEMIKRRAFGFRNFNNYRLRVKALCG